jgi:hypothetical protein
MRPRDSHEVPGAIEELKSFVGIVGRPLPRVCGSVINLFAFRSVTKERLGRNCNVWLSQISVLKEMRGVTTYRCLEPATPDGLDERELHKHHLRQLHGPCSKLIAKVSCVLPKTLEGQLFTHKGKCEHEVTKDSTDRSSCTANMVDKHDKTYKCSALDCKRNQGFASLAILRRHETEIHGT